MITTPLWYWTIIVLVVITVGVGAVGLLILLEDWLHSTNEGVASLLSLWGRKKSFSVIIGLVILIVLPFRWLEFVGSNQILVNGSEVIQAFPQNAILWQWKWNDLTKDLDTRLGSYKTRLAVVSIKAYPITENPKVRSLRIVVAAKSTQSPEEFVKLVKIDPNYALWTDNTRDVSRKATYSALERHLQSLLYEFAEIHSKQLAELYNPLNSRQQLKFQSLAVEFLEPKLKEVGSYVDSAHFQMAD